MVFWAYDMIHHPSTIRWSYGAGRDTESTEFSDAKRELAKKEKGIAQNKHG
jgi:hypothetical protein